MQPIPTTLLRDSVTTIRRVVATSTAQKFVYQDPDRRFVLLQNLDDAESVEICSSQNAAGELIPPTGARLIDQASSNELWIRNPNNNNPVTVCIEEVIGYNPWEIRVCNALENIARLLAARQGVRL